RDDKGTETQILRLSDLEPNKLIAVDARRVDVIIEPIAFKPRLGTRTSPDLDRQNNGWFKVDFTPPTDGEYKLRVEYADAPDNFTTHKYSARPEVPVELDNIKPDIEGMKNMASSAAPVLARIKDEKVRDKVRNALRLGAGEVKPGEAAPPKGEGDE